MEKCSPSLPTSLFRGMRLTLHLVNGILLAVIYPHLNQARQTHAIRNWSLRLLAILNIGIRIKGKQPTRSEGGCLMVSNHISWLDIFVMNAIQPARFIAKAEVRGWPLIGWLCRRGGTLFISRSQRQDASKVSRRVSHLLKQGACIGLFPEGTTTDGKQVGHFHSALIQPAISAGARLCPMALRYLDEREETGSAAAFIGDTTLVQSIWRILRSPHLNAQVMFTPALMAANMNRRVLAQAAQDAIAQQLKMMGPVRKKPEEASSALLQTNLQTGLPQIGLPQADQPQASGRFKSGDLSPHFEI